MLYLRVLTASRLLERAVKLYWHDLLASQSPAVSPRWQTTQWRRDFPRRRRQWPSEVSARCPWDRDVMFEYCQESGVRERGVGV